MSDYALDASALLTLLFGERGAERVEDVISASAISAINLAEAVAKLQDHGVPDNRIRYDIEALGLIVVPCDSQLALEIGLMRAATRGAGLSLGDRACLALARSIGAVAMTADRAWLNVDVGVPIELIR